MKITLDIKDSKFNTFLAFIKTLDYVSVSERNEIHDWQIEEVNRRLETLKKHPEKAIDIENTLNRIGREYGL